MKSGKRNSKNARANSGAPSKGSSDGSQFPALLFDLDGTLVDSVYQHVDAWGQALADAEIEVSRWKIHRRIGMSGKSLVRELLRETRVGRRNIDSAQLNLEKLEHKHDAAFSRMVPGVRALPGADDLLAYFSRKGLRFAIATTGSKAQTSRLLKKLKLPADVPVLTGDDVEKAKPSPDVFVAAAQRLKVAISDCIVVGDSVWDLLAAGRKSALGVGLLSGGSALEDLERAGAFRVYSDAQDLLVHIEQLGLPQQ